ncbi:thioredoxin domain-containing protein [Gaiella sp.]|uniref:DsbA family protein n=1 Tax=Gaiella sp. TaxID=2663207 RepID=UPI0032633149
MPPVPKPPSESKRNRTLVIAIAVAIAIAGALVAGSYLTRDKGDDAPVAETTATETETETTATETTGTTSPALAAVAGIPQNGTVLGNPEATVRLLQFEDIQCPICKKYTDNAFPAIVDEYVKPGLIQIDFRGLAFLGPDSEKALRIAVAAGFQDKLWEVVGLFYENQGEENSGWVTDALVDEILADVPGLDAAKARADAKSAAVTKEIAAVQAEATTLKVPGTPWFYIAIGLNPPYEIQPTALEPSAFRPALDDALKG